MGKAGAVLGMMLVMVWSGLSFARAETSPDELQQRFDRKYQQYLRADSQMLLPLPTMEVSEWKHLEERALLQKVFSEPDVYYNAKVYTFTLFKVERGEYYLRAKGGFWGMDELFYGPLKESDFE